MCPRALFTSPIAALVVTLRVMLMSASSQAAPGAANTIPLQLLKEMGHDVEFTEKAGGLYEIRTTGGDPHVFTAPVKPDYDSKSFCIVSFEYYSLQPVAGVEVFFGPPISGKQKTGGIDLLASEEWAASSIDLRTSPAFASLEAPPTRFRLDFGRLPNRAIQIRRLCLRPPTPQEDEAIRSMKQKEQILRERDAHVREYLAQEFPAAIECVMVGKDTIDIRGVCSDTVTEGLCLCEAPPWEEITEVTKPGFTRKIDFNAGDAKEFCLTVPRFDGERDRIYSRWFVDRKEGDACRLASHGVYATDLQGAARWDYTEEPPATQKGLGGIMSDPKLFPDLLELGVKNITVNILVTSVLRLRPDKDTFEFRSQGKTYYINRPGMERLDQLLEFADKNGIRASAIILTPRLVGNPQDSAVITHPDSCAPGKYSLANVVAKDGFEAYCAFIDFLASRYCTPGREHGRITHWIIHNEINAAWIWTNAGRKTAALYMNDYVRSMRAVYHTARKYNPRAKVFVSFARNWNDREAAGTLGYTARELTELLLAYSRAEGDFEWGFAYHTYPPSHGDPTTVWKDDKDTFRFDTPAITFKNVEVLDAYVKRPEVMYRGAIPRTVLLSEQGVGTRDYSEESLRNQAAGIVYAWKKIRDLPSIEAFHYHRWIDVEDEGGNYYGLWTVEKGSKNQLDRKKPSHDLYAKLGTPEEDAACRFALPILGIKDFLEIPYKGKIAE